MAKTLADMTPEERAECVGMWASHQGHEVKNEPCGNLGVVSEIDNGLAWISFPKENAETYPFSFEDVTPRFDLPRAWMPDGEPVDGSWEKSTAELPTKNYKATFTQHYRRWVGEWEKNNE